MGYFQYHMDSRIIDMGFYEGLELEGRSYTALK